MRQQARARRQGGASSIELVITLPIVGLLGLGALQFGLVMQQKNALNFALEEAARAGSVGNATTSSIEGGLARGLMPVMVGAASASDVPAAMAKTAEKIAEAKANGFMSWRQLSPTKEAFQDFGVKNKSGQLEIPNDNLLLRSTATGAKSGQNILDANVLKLEMTYGMPLDVPLVGKLYSTLVGAFTTDPVAKHMLESRRMPINLAFATRMQSPAIEGGAAVGHTQTPSNGSSLGLGQVGAAPDASTLPSSYKDIGGGTSQGGVGMHWGNGDVNPTDPDHGGGNNCPGGGGTVTESLSTDLLFDFGSATLSAGGKSKLDQLISQAQSRNFESVKLTGHTDQLGSDAVNDPLSLNRAKAVKEYLESHGFPNKPIATEGKGSHAPVVALGSCPGSGQAQKDCLAPNRRVDITFEGLQ